MKNIAVMIALLLGGFGLALLGGAGTVLSGRIGIAAVFGFTALGHFVKTGPMAAMLPPGVPAARVIVIASGVFEAVLAGLVVFPAHAKAAGLAICVFLVLVTPLNIQSAIRKVDFGGHGAGPRYLWLRLPLQGLLLGWTYWFAVRPG